MVLGVEQHLNHWINEKRQQYEIVTRHDIMDHMLQLVQSYDTIHGTCYSSTFKASDGWFRGFMRRFHKSIRSPTSFIQRSATPHGSSSTQDTTINEKIKNYHHYLTHCHREYSISNVYNVDQTPLWWNAMASQQRTVDNQGSNQVVVRTLPGNQREKVSVILACDQHGKKLPPSIVVATHRKLPRARIRLVDGVVVFEKTRTSMSNSDIMQRWIRIMMDQSSTNSYNENHCLLLMDSFAGHRTEQIREACQATRTIRALIPGGLTSKLQPLDLTVNRSFKCKMKRYYREVLSKTNQMMTDGIPPKERLRLLCGAVRRAWNDVRASTIRKGFQKMWQCVRGVTKTKDLRK